MTDATPNTMPKTPWNMGRLCRGIMFTKTIMAPVKMPAEPKPAMARPTMNVGEVGATPQMREPISKTMMLLKYVLHHD